jgi:pilus assembly protein CpaF
MRDGSRRIVQIAEVQGMEGDIITMTDLFIFEQTGYEKNRIIGRLRPTGLRPKCIDRIEDAGIHLPPAVFGIGERTRY